MTSRRRKQSQKSESTAEDVDDFATFGRAGDLDGGDDDGGDNVAPKRRRTAAGADTGAADADPDAAVDRTDKEEDAVLRGLPSFMHDLSMKVQADDDAGRETFVASSSSAPATTAGTGGADDDEPLYEITSTPEDWARDFVAKEDVQINEMLREWSMPGDAERYTAAAYGLDMRKGMPLILISNLITVAETRQRLSSERISSRGIHYGMRFNPKKFAAVVKRMRKPDVTITVFPPGLLISLGSRELVEAMRATSITIDEIRSMTDNRSQPLYENLRVKAVKLRNVVATAFLFFGINFEKLLENHFVSFEESFIGCIVKVHLMHKKYAKRRIKVLAFEEGAIVITGTKNRVEVLDVYAIVFPYLARCAVFDRAGAGASTTATSKRKNVALQRTEADRRRARALPPTSKEIIHLSEAHIIRMYVEANNLQPTGAAASKSLVPVPLTSRALVRVDGNETEAERRVAELGTRFKRRATDETANMRNTIALTTMLQHTEQERQRVEFEERRKEETRRALKQKLMQEPTRRELDRELKRRDAPKHTNILSYEESMALAEDIITN
jgi:TATA-box binding protein (TBP) (component of TFIID and TFIIIB)